MGLVVVFFRDLRDRLAARGLGVSSRTVVV